MAVFVKKIMRIYKGTIRIREFDKVAKYNSFT